MTKLTELDLEFDFSDALSAYQFDVNEIHASSTIKRVDFIAEYDDHYRYIEVKDPDQPGVANPNAFVEKLRSGKLNQSLAGKFRDTLFFRNLCGQQAKPIRYIVLLAMRELDPALLMNQQDLLHRSIPLRHNNWREQSAQLCLILNLSQYKRNFGERSVRRISEGGI